MGDFMVTVTPILAVMVLASYQVENRLAKLVLRGVPILIAGIYLYILLKLFL